MQLCTNYVNLKHSRGQKINVIVIKAAHRRSILLKTLVSHKISTSIGLRKNLYKISGIFNQENVSSIFTKNLVNVAMRMEGAVHTSQYFYELEL